MIRLFVGLALPPPLRRHLAAMMAGLPGAHWVPEDNLHLTLRFIGEVDEPTAAAVDEGLAAIQGDAFELTIRGCGTFHSGRRPHTLWAGVEAAAPLLALQDKVDKAVMRAGLPADNRRFSPHIKLARLKDTPLPRLQAFVAGHNLLRETVWIDSFVLYSSLLGRGDPLYRAEADYPLNQDGGHGR